MKKLYFNPDCLYSYKISKEQANKIRKDIDSFDYSLENGTMKSAAHHDLSLNNEYKSLFTNIHKGITETLKDLGRRRSVFLDFIGKICITQSWVVVNKQKLSYKEQIHPNSLFTGIIVLDDWDDNFGKLNIKMHDKGIWAQRFMEVRDKQISVGFREAGGMIIFPSDLPVSIEENRSDRDQAFIFFNTFIDGSIGNNNDRNKLNIHTLGVKGTDIEEESLQDSQIILDLSGDENIY